MTLCGVNERDGKIRECEDDDVWRNEISVSIIMLVCLSGVNKRKQLFNQESNTVLQISSNEGRECGSSTKQAEARLKYDCGHSDSIRGRSPRVVMSLNRSLASLFTISE